MKQLYLCIPLATLILNTQIAQAHPDSSIVLAKGDAYVSFEIARNIGHNSFETTGSGGIQKLDSTFEVIGFSYGLGDSWQAGLDFANVSDYDLYKKLNDGQSSLSTKIQEQHNASGLWAKYGFVDDINSPFSLAGELDFEPDFNSGTDGALVASLIGGWDFGDGLTSITTYTEHIPQNPDNSEIHTISFGVSKAITDSFSLKPDIYFSKIEASALRKTTHQFGGGITASLRLGMNYYIESTLSAFQSAPQDSSDGKSHWGDVYGKTLAVTICRKI